MMPFIGASSRQVIPTRCATLRARHGENRWRRRKFQFHVMVERADRYRVSWQTGTALAGRSHEHSSTHPCAASAETEDGTRASALRRHPGRGGDADDRRACLRLYAASTIAIRRTGHHRSRTQPGDHRADLRSGHWHRIANQTIRGCRPPGIAVSRNTWGLGYAESTAAAR